jgi:hypothetical protein
MSDPDMGIECHCGNFARPNGPKVSQTIQFAQENHFLG